MIKYEKELQTAIDSALAKNALILFDLNNIAVRFSYQRHICSKISEIPGRDKHEQINNSIIMAISLWLSWEIHIRNAKYPYEWYGCVQVEDQWILNGVETSPYVIFNSENPDDVRRFSKFKTVDLSEFPVDIKKFFDLGLKELTVKKAFFQEDESTVWRLCE